MKIETQIEVKTPADILKHARNGVISVTEAARATLLLSGWTESETSFLVEPKKPVKKTVTDGAKKAGRPSGYDSKKGELAALVGSNYTTANIADELGISVPTARAWVIRLEEERRAARIDRGLDPDLPMSLPLPDEGAA